MVAGGHAGPRGSYPGPLPSPLALSKLARNSPIDREDVARLARAVPLDPVVRRERYETELRPIIIGDLARHDQTLALWLEAYFG